MPRITVDGKIIEVPAGRTILQALDDVGLLMNGVDVPHYCWHPKLSIDGSCRLCQVEVRAGEAGEGRLQIACPSSCGQCTQCREGTGWMNRVVQRIERGGGTIEDLAILKDVCAKLEGQTICAFSDAAAWPVQGLLRHFVQDFQSHISEKCCPFPESFDL